MPAAAQDAYTAHGRPYIDILEPGRLTIALPTLSAT
jgi:hypothetical protein